MSGNIFAVYFSPTRTTKTITGTIAGILSRETDKAAIEADLTRSSWRGREYSCASDDIFLLGFPVYGGRIPRVLAETLSKLKGDRTAAVIVAVYGNRDYDDALVEAEDILRIGGFTVAAAGAFIGEHSFSRKLAAAGRSSMLFPKIFFRSLRGRFAERRNFSSKSMFLTPTKQSSIQL